MNSDIMTPEGANERYPIGTIIRFMDLQDRLVIGKVIRSAGVRASDGAITIGISNMPEPVNVANIHECTKCGVLTVMQVGYPVYVKVRVDDVGQIEKLAALEHEQWAHWTKYMLDNLTIDNILRWVRQIVTPYAELSEAEKKSDRIWAQKVIDCIRDGESNN